MIITIANHKGGVAKSTTTYNLGVGLAKLGAKILLVDLDTQGNLTQLTGLQDKLETYNTIASIFYADKDKKKPITECIYGIDNYFLIPSNDTLQKALNDLFSNGTNKEYKLQLELKKVYNDFDFILIDTAPSIDLGAINGIIASDFIITPIACEYLSKEGTADILKFIMTINETLEEIGQKPKQIDRALITRYRSGTQNHKQNKEEIYKILDSAGIKHFDTIIRENTDVSKAQESHKSVLDFAPNSNGAEDYTDLTNELLTIISEEMKGAWYE